MDEVLMKAGQWPNVAVPAGSDPKQVMEEYGVQPPSVFAVDDTGMDSREKLEADISKWWEEEWPRDFYTDEDMVRVVGRWLDRQAAITSLEWLDGKTHIFGMTFDEVRGLQAKVAELTAERDELKERLAEAEDRRMQTLAEAIFGTYIGEPQEKIAELKAENERLQDVVRKQAESFRKLEQELKEAKDDR